MTNRFKTIGFILLMILGMSWAPLYAAAPIAHSAQSYLPESREGRVPSARVLIRRTKSIFDSREFKISAPIRRFFERLFNSLSDLIERIVRFFEKHPSARPGDGGWLEILKILSLPIIVGTIAYAVYYFASRFKRDIKETRKEAQSRNESWQGLIQNAKRIKDFTPLEALHDLVQAVIRRYVTLGQLPDDPTLTIREIERHLRKKSLTGEQSACFDTLRSIYESAYYGGRFVTADDWGRIFAAVNGIVGEAVL